MPVIAMTREIGSLGTDVAAGVANRLSLEIVRSEVAANNVAKRLGVPEGAVTRYLEGSASLLERWQIDHRKLFKYAAEEILGFYRNYHSIRWVGDLLVLRLQVQPSRAELADLNRRFADIVLRGNIRAVGPFPPERNDHPELPRLALRFDRFHYSRLRQLIDAINECTG